MKSYELKIPPLVTTALALALMVVGFHTLPFLTIFLPFLFWTGMALVTHKATLLSQNGSTTPVTSLGDARSENYAALAEVALRLVGLPGLRLELLAPSGTSQVSRIDARSGRVLLSREEWDLEPHDFQALILTMAYYEKSLVRAVAEKGLFVLPALVLVVRLACVLLLGATGLGWTEAVVVTLATYCLGRALRSGRTALSLHVTNRSIRRALASQGPDPIPNLQRSSVG